MQIAWQDYIESTLSVLRGKPRIKRTRISVSLILGYLAAGGSTDQNIAELPDLHSEHVAACLDYARAFRLRNCCLMIAKAQELRTILVSLNGDFADIVTYPPSSYKGVIALQVRDHPEVIPALMRRLVGYLSTRPEMVDYEGRLLVAEAHRIRIRH